MKTPRTLSAAGRLARLAIDVGVVMVLIAFGALAVGCARQAAHSVSPARSMVLEAWVEHPPVEIGGKAEGREAISETEGQGAERGLESPPPGGRAAKQQSSKAANEGTRARSPGSDFSSWNQPPPNPHCYEPFRAALVVAVLGQVAERPETSSERTSSERTGSEKTTAEAGQPGVTVKPDGTVILGPGGHVRMSESEGSGLETTAGDLAAGWRTEAPTAVAGDIAASGGGLRHVMEATGVRSEPGAVLFVIGGLILAGGVAVFFLVNRKLGAAIAAAGAAVLLAAWLVGNPVAMFAVCGVGLLAVVGSVLWYGRAARADALALSAVTASVKTAANGSATAIKESVKTAAGGQRPVVDKAITRALLRAGEKP